MFQMREQLKPLLLDGSKGKPMPFYISPTVCGTKGQYSLCLKTSILWIRLDRNSEPMVIKALAFHQGFTAHGCASGKRLSGFSYLSEGSCVTDLALCGAQILNVQNEVNEYWELVLEITIFKNHWNN